MASQWTNYSTFVISTRTDLVEYAELYLDRKFEFIAPSVREDVEMPTLQCKNL